VQPKVTRAEAVRKLAGLLGAKPERVQLVWADERTTDVVLEWTGYSPHARVRVDGGPGGVKVPRYFRGPADAWLNANSGFPIGVGSVSHRKRAHHYAVPGRTYLIPVTLVEKLWKENLRVRLAPIRVRPAVSRKLALTRFRRRGLQPREIWLVIAQRRTKWLIASGHGRYSLLDASK
jgi:hypothetical protein